MSADGTSGVSTANGLRHGVTPEGSLQGSLEALAQLSTQRSNLRETLTHVATLAVRAVPGAEGAGLTLFEPDRPNILVATSPFVVPVDAAQYGIGQGPCIMAGREATVVLTRSLGKDRRWPDFGQAVAQLGVQSSLSLPLITADGVIGTINIYAHRKRAFSGASEREGQLYSISAAIAVHSAQQLHNTQTSAGVIAKAIALVMKRARVGAVEAFQLLQDFSERRQIELSALAQLVVDRSVTVERLGRLGPH
ncbi:MAG TPA: GAF and ANTAR domain-containing protein [Propionibacteriaceae bacterium]|nr:GAF and ANTAR domain-containing protein [Propionibacteriaceae bacterium]